GCHMKHHLRSPYGPRQRLRIEQISLDKPKSSRGLGRCEKRRVAGRKIVVAGYGVPPVQQAVDEVAPDKAGGASDKCVHRRMFLLGPPMRERTSWCQAGIRPKSGGRPIFISCRR